MTGPFSHKAVTSQPFWAKAWQLISEKAKAGELPLQYIDQETFTTALKQFNPRGSKQNTLFDAQVLAIAKTSNARAIFSFDAWYKKQGFTSASELLTEEKQAA